MRNLLKALYISLLFSFVITQNDESGILARLKKVEENINLLKADVELAYHDNSLTILKDCKPSYHQCTDNFPDEYQCNSGHGTIEELCKGCRDGEMKLSYNHTTFLYPEGKFDPNKITAKQKETICVYKGVEESLMKYGNTKTYASLGTYDGMYRVWPMVSRERLDYANDPNVLNCMPFDPRLRPWYIAASTGNKDVIILVDTSFPTQNNDIQIKLIRDALPKILETFSLGDFINVVKFDETAEALYQDQALLSMRNIDSVNELKQEVQGLLTQGEVNFTDGFKKAFDLFEEALDNEHENQNFGNSSDCTQILIVFTDGNVINGENNIMEIIDYVSERQNQIKDKYNKEGVNIFTYTVGDESDDFLARTIACKNKGAWRYIDINQDILAIMNSYFLFIADGKHNQEPVWSYPYDDAFGLGPVTSCAIPFYYSPTPDVNMFLGVIVLDVLISEFNEELTEEETEDLIDQLFEESLTCVQLNTTPCKLQVLRSSAILENGQSSLCANDLEESGCYSYALENENGTKMYYYIRYTNATSWTEANDDCIKNGGILSPVRDEKHMYFLASVSKLGSWIGLRYFDTESTFKWTDITIDEVDEDYVGWTSSTKFDSDNLKENQCVTIDFRGSDHNMQLKSCENDMIQYICEFEDGQEPGDVCDENELFEFISSENDENPYIGECSVEQSRIVDILSVNEGVYDLNNSTDVCQPLIENSISISETTFKDRTCCCDEPSDDSTSTLVIVPVVSIIFIFVLLILYLIIAFSKGWYPLHLYRLDETCFEHYFCYCCRSD